MTRVVLTVFKISSLSMFDAFKSLFVEFRSTLSSSISDTIYEDKNNSNIITKQLKAQTSETSNLSNFFGQMPFFLKHLYRDYPTKNDEQSAMNSQGKKIAIYCTCHG